MIKVLFILVVVGPYGHMERADVGNSPNYGWTKEQCTKMRDAANEKMAGILISYEFACLPQPYAP